MHSFTFALFGVIIWKKFVFKMAILDKLLLCIHGSHTLALIYCSFIQVSSVKLCSALWSVKTIQFGEIQKAMRRNDSAWCAVDSDKKLNNFLWFWRASCYHGTQIVPRKALFKTQYRSNPSLSNSLHETLTKSGQCFYETDYGWNTCICSLHFWQSLGI